MNRNNKILVGVLALIVAMTIGYAIFSDKITITGTAKAKGDFSITATCTKGLFDEKFTEGSLTSGAPKLDNNYENDSCTVEGNKVNYSAELLQPGAVRNFTVKITNSGSIDASLNPSDGLIENFKGYIGNYDTGEFIETEDIPFGMNGFYIVGLEKNDGTLIYGTENNIDKVMDFFDETQENLVLKPGESMYVVVSAEWDINDGTADHITKRLYKETSTFEFIFNQLAK